MSRIISDAEIRDTYYHPQTSRDGATRLRAVAITQRNASDREWVLEVEQLRQEIENKWASAEIAGLDQSNPKMSGLEATRQLRQLPDFSHTPIIAITAYAMKGDQEKLLAAGCDAYLPKPINTRELPEVISEMLFPPPKDKPGPEGDNGEPEDSSH